MKKSTIKQYVRDRKGRPIGVLVAVKNDVTVAFGWSLCHKSDQFSKVKGTLIAENRANADKSISLPETLYTPMLSFIAKAGRYFTPEQVL